MEPDLGRGRLERWGHTRTDSETPSEKLPGYPPWHRHGITSYLLDFNMAIQYTIHLVLAVFAKNEQRIVLNITTLTWWHDEQHGCEMIHTAMG